MISPSKLQRNNYGQVLAVILSVSNSQSQQNLLFRYPCDTTTAEQKSDDGRCHGSTVTVNQPHGINDCSLNSLKSPVRIQIICVCCWLSDIMVKLVAVTQQSSRSYQEELKF